MSTCVSDKLPVPLLVACKLLESTVAANSSGHVAASVANSLFLQVCSKLESQVCSDDEVEARLGAIRPSIAAGLIGENVSGSSKAMRNVACHNFQIEVKNLSPLDAKRIQRGGRKRAATREAIKEETDPLCDSDPWEGAAYHASTRPAEPNTVESDGVIDVWSKWCPPVHVDHMSTDQNEYYQLVSSDAMVQTEIVLSEAAAQTDRIATLMVDAACEAEARDIRRHTEKTRSDWSFRKECLDQQEQHLARYPGGTLPFDIRDVDEYVRRKKVALECAGKVVPRCQFCDSTG